MKLLNCGGHGALSMKCVRIEYVLGYPILLKDTYILTRMLLGL